MDHQYEVDIPAYTCTCFDFPLINYCKHICAVQHWSPEVVEQRLISSPEIHTLSSPDADSSESVNTTDAGGVVLSVTDHTSCTGNSLVPISESFRLARKLETLAGRLRQSSTAPPVSVLGLKKDLDTALVDVFSGLLLPQVVRIPPNIKCWTETQAVMMPAKKGRRKRAGDDAYGAGENSGKKAKKAKAKARYVIAAAGLDSLLITIVYLLSQCSAASAPRHHYKT